GVRARGIEELHGMAPALFEPLRQKLTRLGLLIPDESSWKLRLIPATVLLAVLAFGAIKIVVGLSRHRPVEYQTFLCFGVVVITVIELRSAPIRSLLGDGALTRLRARNAALRVSATIKPQ